MLQYTCKVKRVVDLRIRISQLTKSESIPIHEDYTVKQEPLVDFLSSASWLVEQESGEHELQNNGKTSEPVLKTNKQCTINAQILDKNLLNLQWRCDAK